MNRHLAALWQRVFDDAFLAYCARGAGEDLAIALAERDADFGLDRYCDDKFEDRRTQ